MDKETAETFAKEWITSFNSHHIDDIMSHYAETIEFCSPFISLLKFNDKGIITSKTELQKYFEVGLNAYPDLYFTLHHFFIGVDTLIIYYTSVNQIMAAEVFQLNVEGKAAKVFCHYIEK